MDTLVDKIRNSREMTNWRRGDAYWITNNSPIEDYDKTFKTVLGGSRIIDIVLVS